MKGFRLLYVQQSCPYGEPATPPPEPIAGATEWQIVNQAFSTYGAVVVWRCWIPE